jgi:hypothetical protein
MFWKTFFFSFVFNNKNIIRNKLSCILESDSLPDYMNIYNITNSNGNNLETINYIHTPKVFKAISGYDLRYNKTENSTVYNISRYFRILEILKVIESSSISVNDKLDIIDQYNNDISVSKYVSNIYANNLINDW